MLFGCHIWHHTSRLWRHYHVWWWHSAKSISVLCCWRKEQSQIEWTRLKNEYHSISLLSVSAGKSPFVLRISTDQDPSSLIRFKMVHSSAYLIAAKICLFIGTIGVAGNTLSAIVIVKNWTKTSSEVYLVALAACDNVYTLSTILYATWYLGAPGIDCECALIFAFISTSWSAWTIVLISLERLLVTWYPRQKNAICHVEVGWALLMTVTMSTLIFQFNMYGGMARLEMANSTVRTHRLDINRTHAVSCVGHTPAIAYYMEVIYLYIDSVLFCIIPGIIIVICCCSMLCKMRSDRHQVVDSRTQPNLNLLPISSHTRGPRCSHRFFQVSEYVAGSSRGNDTDHDAPRSARNNIQNTSSAHAQVTTIAGTRTSPDHTWFVSDLNIIAVVFSVSFIVSNFPNAICIWFIDDDWNLDGIDPGVSEIAFIMSMIMKDISHCKSVFVYAIVSSRFRENLMKLFAFKIRWITINVALWRVPV